MATEPKCKLCSDTGFVRGFNCPLCNPPKIEDTLTGCPECYTITEPGKPPYKKCSGDCKKYKANDDSLVTTLPVRVWPIVFSVN